MTKMVENSCKKSRLVVISSILVLTILMAMSTQASASAVNLYKTTVPDHTARYQIGDTINYEMMITNPAGVPQNPNNYFMVVDISDIYPNGTVELMEASLHLNAGESKMFNRSYVVDKTDIDSNGRVVNRLSVEGIDEAGDRIVISVSKQSKVVGSIGDYVWNDLNGDAVQDGGESGIPNVKIDLYDNLNALVATTTTNASGGYDFLNLLMGTYRVDVDETTLPASYVLTTANEPLDVVLDAGDDYNDADFGYIELIPSIDIEKSTNGDDADTPTGPLVPVGDAVNWEYVVTNTGTTELTSVAVVDDQGVSVSCPKTSLTVGESMTCTASGTATTGQYENEGTAIGTPPVGSDVSDTDPSHYFGVQASIDIEKSTNGADADTPTGPLVPVGNAVNWKYVVTNTGNTELTSVLVTDDQGVSVSCPKTSLAASESMTCTASGTATVGQYANNGTATGTPPVGSDVSDADPSHYFGVRSSIDIEKSTNGADADTPTGPLVPVGNAVNWKYVVTNTGNTELTSVGVTDDQGVSVSCPKTTLAAGESMNCTASDTATVGQYANNGTATGTPPVGSDVSDIDPSHYFGVRSSIDIEKSTNGADADTPTGPLVPVGNAVNWKYVVTNTGNTELTSVGVTDDQGVSVSCPKATLAAGESMNCTASDTATVGQYANNGTATGTPPVGSDVSDTDPSHYFGSAPSIDIEKSTNGADADTPTGPQIPVGDAVNWEYAVNNSGNVELTNIVVTDDQGVSVSCPKTTLVVDESMTCTASGTATAGQYANNGTATGTPPVGSDVSDTDPSHYMGYCTGIIGDYVWLDKDADGIQDAGELGIAGVTVNLYLNSILIASDVTNSTGNYLFTDLCEGEYTVEINDSTLPPEVELTTPPEPRIVNMGIGDVILDVDFGYKCTGAIGDYVWSDVDGDGIQDAGEVGIAGVEINLYRDDGDSVLDAGDTLLGTQVTNATGYYLFEDLCSGLYIVEVNDSTLPADVVLTTPTEPRAVDLDTSVEKLRLDVDFGYRPPCPCKAAIGDHIWMDTDNDGIYDADESGIGGVMVKLYQDNNGDGVVDAGDNLLVIKVTGANGNYLFTELCEGKYIIAVDESSLPPGVSLTTPPEPKAVDLQADQYMLGVDFGYARPIVTSPEI